jgi:hypothetical protein
MLFQFNTHEQYLNAYKYLLVINEPFAFIYESSIIEISNPDDEVVDHMNKFMTGYL